MSNEHLKPGIEIERKYIIRKPDIKLILNKKGSAVSEIEQIYLLSSGNVTHRVRRRTTDGIARYYETVKTRIDKMSVIEEEGEIDAERYFELLSKRDPKAYPIHKTRYTLDYSDFTFEIDVYPEWENTAILEVELEDRCIEPTIPSFISVVREVTGVKEYSNASMSRHFPTEDKL